MFLYFKTFFSLYQSGIQLETGSISEGSEYFSKGTW